MIFVFVLVDKCRPMPKFSFVGLLIFLVSKLPFPVMYLLSDGLYLMLYYVLGYRKKVVRENLSKAFPEKSEAERKSIEKQFFKYLPDLLLESLKMRSISEKQVRKRFRLIHTEELQKHFAAGKSVVALTAHYGNWEFAIHGLCLAIDEPVLIVYKPLNNKTSDRIFNKIRSRFGAVMVPMKQTLRYIVKHRQTPHISVFVADQTPRYEESDYFIKFLNQDTLVYTGAEKVARKFDSPVVFCRIDRVRRGYYTGTLTTLTDEPGSFAEHEITNLYNRFTEDIIREQPAYWLWSHRRWKRQPLKNI